MAFQSVPGTVQAEIVATLHGKRIENTFYFQRATEYNLDDLEALGNAVSGAWAQNLVPRLSNEYAIQNVTVTGLTTINDIQAIVDTDAGTTGTSLIPSVPLNVAFCIKLTSGLTGRSARGRVYIAGCPEDMVNQSAVSQAYASLLVTGVSLTLSAGQAAAWNPVIVSRYTNGAKRAQGETFTLQSISYTKLGMSSRRDRLDT